MLMDAFSWGVGFEGSFLPHLGVDQYDWTQHNAQWKGDFALVVAKLQCRSARYPIPWHLIETTPGCFCWNWLDERVAFAEQLGLHLIPDLVHFGTPRWLPDSFGDSDFPAALERFAGEFGKRYAGRMLQVCPLNEPTTTALFCGEFGHWPPHGRDLHTYMSVLSRTVQGLSRAIAALRDTMPGVSILCTEPLDIAFVAKGEPDFLLADAAWRNDRRHLALDLLTGRVDNTHVLHDWLIEHGFSPLDLKWFARNPAQFDVLGADYYRHTEVELYASETSECKQRVPASPAGLAVAARAYWDRYQKPMLIAETSVTGSEDDRIEWLNQTVSQVRTLREEGVPVLGYYWWPVIDHLDWDGALLHRTGHIHPVGLFRLQRNKGGQLVRHETNVGIAYRNLINSGCSLIGDICQPTESEAVDRDREAKSAVSADATILNVKTVLDTPIIVHSHLAWDWVWQRPQQFLSRMSKRRYVLFIEGPLLSDDEAAPSYALHSCPEFPNITVMQTTFPRSRFADGAWVDSERLRLLQHALANELRGRFVKPVQWFYDPMAVKAFAGALDEEAIVYDCMDQLSQFKFAPPELAECEARLLRCADLVFAGGRKLWEAKKLQNPNCHFYGCGVDVAHFGKARSPEAVIPFDLDFIPRPILGYFGVVDERLDYELISQLAAENPEWSIAMIGPVCKVDPNGLPRPRNVYWMGGRDYADLPAYARGFDACLMPFALNEATEFINPTKALEYMATGTPIVSTAVPDVVSNFDTLVKIGYSSREFIEHCKAALSAPEPGLIERAIVKANDNTWEMIVSQLEGHLCDVLRKKRLTQLRDIAIQFDSAA